MVSSAANDAEQYLAEVRTRKRAALEMSTPPKRYTELYDAAKKKRA